MSAVRQPLIANIKTRLAFKMSDDSEVKTIVARTQLVMEDLPGRGLIALDQPEIFQVALPAFGDNNLAIIHNLQEEAKKMDKQWSGERPRIVS